MALTATQIQQLNDAASRRTSGSATPEDVKNLDYAIKTFGYKAPTAPATVATTAAPMPQGVSSPTRTATQTLQAWDSNTGQQIWVTPGQYVPGASLTKPNIPTSMSAGQLGNANPITPAPAPTPTPVAPFVSGLTAGTNMESILNMTSPELTQAEATQSSLSQKLLDQLSALTGRSAKTQELTTAAGLPEMQKQLADINVQIAQKAAAFDKQMVDEQGKPILNAIIGGRTSLIQRQKAVELGGLSAVAQAMQGNISAAQNTIKETVQMEYEDQMDQINALKTQLEVNRESMTDAQKKLADKQAILLDERSRLLEEESTTRKGILDMAVAVAQNGAPSNVTSAMSKARTIEEALKIGGEYLAQIPEYASGIIGEYQFYADQVMANGGNPMDFNEYQNLDANRKIAIQKAGIAGFDSQAVNLATRIADKFDANVITKNFAKMAEAKTLVDSLSNTTTNPADDQALIYAFAKAMDPDSVVREGEYATVQKYSQSWVKSYGKGIEQAINGTGFLSQQARENIKKTIESKYNAGKLNYDNFRNETASSMDSIAPGLSDMFLKKYNVENVNQLSDSEARAKISDVYNSSPKNVQSMINELFNAKIPPNDILAELGFKQVGGDTNKAISKANEIKTGTKFGQCGRFVNQLTGLGLGDSYASKLAKMDKSITEPKPGMAFIMPYSWTGHTGIILSVKNGIATVKDSNWSLDEKVKVHQIPVSKMTGFAYPKTA